MSLATTTNSQSWRELRRFIEESPDDGWAKWKSIALDLVGELEACKLVDKIRAGQSMHHLIFSAVERHELNDEPRVTVVIDPKNENVRVTYGYRNLHFSEPKCEQTVTAAESTNMTMKYLAVLWQETRPNEALPDALGAA